LKEEKIYPKWLHVLRPKEDGTQPSTTGQWEGKIRVLKTSIGESEARLGEHLSQMKVKSGELEVKLEEAKEEAKANANLMEQKILTMEDQMTEVDTKVDKALKLLQQLVNVQQAAQPRT
jgi:hypothetical protein